MTDDRVLFKERTVAWLLVLPCLGAALLALVLLQALDPAAMMTSDDRWAVILVGAIAVLLLVLALGFSSLAISVTDDQLTIGFPIYRRHFALTELVCAQERPYRVLRDFYGLGIRVNPASGEVGFIAFGTSGVRVTPTQGPATTFSCRDPHGALAALKRAGVRIEPPTVSSPSPR